MATAAGRLTVCVTGHDGYVGAALVPALLARGHRVRGIDRFLFRGCAVPDAAVDAPAPAIPATAADIRDLGPRDFAGDDAVVHLAALSNDPLGNVDPALTHAINRDAAIAVAEAAKAAGVRRFVFASTCSVYGAGGDRVDEDGPVAPITAYAASKAEAERAILALADHRFAPVALRFATAYGFSPKLRLDLVVNNLLAHAVSAGQVFLKSTGDAWRPLIHVDDMAGAMLAALAAPAERIAGAAINVGSDDANVRVRTIAERVAEAVPSARIVVADGAVPDRRSYRVSFARLGGLLPGFAPRWTLSAGIADLRDRLARIGLAAGEVEGARYVRLAHLLAEMRAGRLDGALRTGTAP